VRACVRARVRARATTDALRLGRPLPAIPTNRQAILLSERRAKDRAERLAKVRAGQPSGATKRTDAQKATAKAFYKQMIVDSEYQGADYSEFDRWLGVAQ
jgi:topoisomerase IA-like protein